MAAGGSLPAPHLLPTAAGGGGWGPSLAGLPSALRAPGSPQDHNQKSEARRAEIPAIRGCETRFLGRRGQRGRELVRFHAEELQGACLGPTRGQPSRFWSAEAAPAALPVRLVWASARPAPSD